MAPPIRSPITIALEARRKRLAKEQLGHEEKQEERAESTNSATNHNLLEKTKLKHSTAESLATFTKTRTLNLPTGNAPHAQEKKKKKGPTTFLSLPRELRQGILHQTLPISSLEIPVAPIIDCGSHYDKADFLLAMHYSCITCDGNEFHSECRLARERVFAWAETLAQACGHPRFREDVEHVVGLWLKEADEVTAVNGAVWEVELKELRNQLGE